LGVERNQLSGGLWPSDEKRRLKEFLKVPSIRFVKPFAGNKKKNWVTRKKGLSPEKKNTLVHDLQRKYWELQLVERREKPKLV